MKRNFFCGLLLVPALNCWAQNPIVAAGVYIADPSAHVWPDGRLYVYGSRDESPNYYCSASYQVLSSVDLRNWELSAPSFASEGPADLVPYQDGPLYAPDVQYAHGQCFLYYCMPGKSNEGVAVSSSPVGPFKNAKPLYTKQHEQIDPCVFTDDGQRYYVWGQFNAKMAKLKPNMLELDTATIKENVVTQQTHNFHEGSYLIKRQGLYYPIYADVSRAGAPTCLGYSTSKSPMGPYTYRGVIIDNRGCDPATWNNHGSLVAFKGQWDVFYHRATNGSRAMRKACLEPITFRADGSIPEVQMTSQGAAGPLNAFRETDAARACVLRGNVRIQTIDPTNEVLAGIHNGDKAVYKFLDFKAGADSVVIRLAPGPKPCQISLSLDNAWNSPVGNVVVPARQGTEWLTLKVPLKKVKGVHALWLGFNDPARTDAYDFPQHTKDVAETELCQVDSFQFR